MFFTSLSSPLVAGSAVRKTQEHNIISTSNLSTKHGVYGDLFSKEPLGKKKVGGASLFFTSLSSPLVYKPCFSNHLSASMAAIQPVPAAVTACLYTESCTSPDANTPSIEV